MKNAQVIPIMVVTRITLLRRWLSSDATGGSEALLLNAELIWLGKVISEEYVGRIAGTMRCRLRMRITV